MDIRKQDDYADMYMISRLKGFRVFFACNMCYNTNKKSGEVKWPKPRSTILFRKGISVFLQS